MRVPESMQELMLLAVGRFLLAAAANILSGLIAGAILAGGFWLFGAIAGAFYGSLAGVVLGAVAAIRNWSIFSIGVACTAQFSGALVVGFGMSWVDPRSGPPDYAVAGMLAGGAVGVALAEVVHRTIRRGKTRTDGPLCPRCGYSLRGNISGRCPECGRIRCEDDNG